MNKRDYHDDRERQGTGQVVQTIIKCNKSYSELLNFSADCSGDVLTSSQVTNFDDGPEELDLSQLEGFSDCQNCYFRQSTLKRIVQNVKQLHRRQL